MSNVSVDVIFTSKSTVINASRVGNEQTLTIDVSKCDPPDLKIDKDEQRSDNGGRIGTTEHGRWRYGFIESMYITNAERLYFREFFESVGAGEPFTLDVTTYGDCLGFDPDLLVMNVQITDGDFKTPRIDGTDMYSTQFAWQQVSG